MCISCLGSGIHLREASMNSKKILAAFISETALALSAHGALASCRIHNDTGISFTVESGNTSNQSVGAHTTTSIAAGRIIGKSSDGKSVSGFCKDGDNLEIKEVSGVPVIEHK